MFHLTKNIVHFKSVTASFLILLFVFSITPRRILHDYIANHTDSQVSPNIDDNHTNSCIRNSGFNCQCDSLVVTTSFLPAFRENILTSSIEFEVFKADKFFNVIPQFIQYRSFRGPPSIGSFC